MDSVTFMTDVPAMATALLCLAMGCEALGATGRRRWMWLAGSLAVGCFAFSIRQSALAAPVAVLVAATASDSEGRGRYLAAWIATLLTCAGIWLAAASVPVQYQGPLELHLDVMARRMRYAEATLCLVLSPAMALTLLARWRRWLRPPFGAGLAAGVFVFQIEIGIFLSTGTMSTVIIGNVFGRYGYPGGATGYPPLLFDPAAWQLLNVFTLAAGIVGCGMLAVALVDMLPELRNAGRGEPGIRWAPPGACSWSSSSSTWPASRPTSWWIRSTTGTYGRSPLRWRVCCCWSPAEHPRIRNERRLLPTGTCVEPGWARPPA